MSTTNESGPAGAERESFKKWFDELIADQHKIAKETIEEGEEIPPHLLIFDRETDRVALLPVPMGTPSLKNVVASLITHLAQQPMIKAVVLAHEAWILEVKDEEEANRMFQSGEGIADNPARTECVLWTARSGSQLMIACASISGANDKRTLAPAMLFDESTFKGRFANNKRDEDVTGGP